MFAAQTHPATKQARLSSPSHGDERVTSRCGVSRRRGARASATSERGDDVATVSAPTSKGSSKEDTASTLELGRRPALAGAAALAAAASAAAARAVADAAASREYTLRFPTLFAPF